MYVILSLEAKMGKLIPFKKPEGFVHRQGVKSNNSENLNNPKFLVELISELGVPGLEIYPTLQIRAYLNSMVGRISNHAIGALRQGLRNFSLEDLEEMSKNSSRSDWSSKPAFFRALVDEIDSRKLLLS